MADPEPGLSIATVALTGGGRIGICPLPGATGDMGTDLSTIAAWRPSVVVSMTEQAEMDAGGSGDLGQRLGRLGIGWHHLPVRDFGAPDMSSDALWPALSQDLHDKLDRGEAVLLHCKGGRGRSGMIALRLMVERGELPGSCLTRLRAARPGAVETPEQLAWASAPWPGADDAS